MKILKLILNFFISIIYPPVCGLCGKINEEWICKKCLIKIQKEAENKHRGYLKAFYEDGFFAFSYKGEYIKKALLLYKFHNKPYIYRTISKIILKNEKACRFLKKYDIIIPVPIHKNRKLKRGYNQSELIAIEIGKTLNIKVETNCLIKIKNIVPQSTLNKEQRERNVKGVYKLQNIQNLQNKKVVIFDDVYTTGSTLNECAKVIKTAGVSKIGIFTIAKD